MDHATSRNNDNKWKCGLALLGLYGFLVELKPSEAYLNPYLVHDKGFSNSTINNLIYPFNTYGQLLFTFLIPCLSHLISPKRMFYVESCGFFITRLILIHGKSLWIMQLMQLAYAVGTSVKAVYYCYMYMLLVDQRSHFPQATGLVWGAQALGMCLAGLIGQVLFSYVGVSLLFLNYFSMISVCCSLLVSTFIPSQQYAHDVENDNEDKNDLIPVTVDESISLTAPRFQSSQKQQRQQQIATQNGCGYSSVEQCVAEQEEGFCHAENQSTQVSFLAGVWGEYRMAFDLFHRHHGQCARAMTWILAHCCEELLQNYAQVLWTERSQRGHNSRNASSSSSYSLFGIVTASYQAAGVAASLLPVLLEQKRQQSIARSLQNAAVVGLCATMILMTMIDSLAVAYATYVLYGACYYAFISGISCQLASCASVKEQVLLFATNLFCATALETIVTVVLSSANATTETWFWTITAFQLTLLPVFVLSWF